MVGRKSSVISVIIPLYNKSQYIHRALDSVLRQSFQDFDCIVVDDGSTDGSGDIVREINDSRIRVIAQTNAGVSAARNRGVREAASELIAFLDADDAWEPLFLETILRLRQAFPQAGAYATAYRIRKPDRQEYIMDYKGIPKAPWEGIIPDYFVSVIKTPPILSSIVSIPKNVFRDVGFFAEGVARGEDSEMWLRVALKYPIAFSHYIGATYHQESSNRACNTTAIPADPLILSTIRQTLLKENMEHRLSGKLRAYHDLIITEYARTFLLEGKRKAARKLIGRYFGCRKEGCVLCTLSFLPDSLLRAVLAIRRCLKDRLAIE